MAQTRPAEEVTTEQAGPVPATDLDSPLLYLNRELTWLEFNRRVLHEAQDAADPAARAGQVPRHRGVEPRRVLHEAHRRPEAAGGRRLPGAHRRRPHARQQQIAECYAVIRDFEAAQRELFRELLELLARAGRAHRVVSTPCPRRSSGVLREHYYKNIFPLVTPLAMDPAHPFPFISNLSLNLLVTVRYPNDPEQMLARVKVPVGCRHPALPAPRRRLRTFVPLEDVMAHNLDLLFPGMEIDACELFRVTRNAITERDEEEADDLLAMIESELRERRFAPDRAARGGQGDGPGPPRHAGRRARPRRARGRVRGGRA